VTDRGPSAAAAEWVEVAPYADVVTRAAATWPGAVAVDLPGEALTYRELEESVTRTACSFLALGVRPGSHVGVLLPNGLDYLRVTFALSALGAVAVLINSRFQGSELAHVLADADLQAVVVRGASGSADEVDLAGRLTAVLPAPAELPGLEAVVVLGELPAALSGDSRTVGSEAFDRLAAEGSAEEVERLRRQVSVRDVAMMMYTSGTTAQPKGCLLSHELLVRTGAEVARRLGVRQGDRFWDPLPMFHLSSTLPMIGCFTYGARFVTMQHFDAGRALTEMARVRPTHLYPAFPTVIQALAQHPDFGETDFSEVRVVNCIGPAGTLRSLQDRWPDARLVSAYGCTEVGGVIAHSAPGDDVDDRVQTCGPPFPGIAVRVVDASTGEALPPGSRGEVCVRGWSVFEGYHRAPELTRDRTTADGWFRTGDIGSLDDQGRISYHGRLKDMLKVGGENVAAIEVEELLQSHPAVSIAQVVAIPDARLMEVPAAFVELRPGAVAHPDELVDWLRGRLASFKLPRHVRVVEHWPIAATKIQKFKLREQLCLELGIALDG
jgi:fatty-acyl-CoA synthase